MGYWLKFEIIRKKLEPSLFISIPIKVLIFSFKTLKIKQMKYLHGQTLIIKKRIKRLIKKKKEAVERCNHCGGVFKDSEELKNCLMCGREKAHTCISCLYTQKEEDIKMLA